MLSDLEAAERKRLEAASHDTFHITSAQIEAEKQNYRADLAQAQASLSSLGLLQFGEKIRWKKKIEELNLRLAEAEQKLLAARNIRDQEIRSIASRIEQKQAQWQHSAEKAYPIPKEPCPPGMTPQQFENRKYQDAIYPVSYTHLDVYKRQAMPRGQRHSASGRHLLLCGRQYRYHPDETGA